MPVSEEYLAWCLDQLASLQRVTSRKMFGGVGIYSEGRFFALLDGDTLYFKTDATNRAPFEARGMPQFRPFPEKPDLIMNYHRVPEDVIEDPDELAVWARRSVAIANAPRLRGAATEKGRERRSTSARVSASGRGKRRGRPRTRPDR